MSSCFQCLKLQGSEMMTLSASRTLEEQNRQAANAEIDEASMAMSHKGTEIHPYYALPSIPIYAVEFLIIHIYKKLSNIPLILYHTIN